MNMRSLCSVSVLALALPLSAGSAWAAEATSSASARLIQPVTIINGPALNFGTLIKGNLTGPVGVTVDPQIGGFPTIVSSDPAAVTPLRGHTDANFQVTGEPDEVVVISPLSSILLKKEGGGTSAREMTVSDVLIDVWEPGVPGTDLLSGNSFTMPAGAVAYLEVGGKLTVEPEDELGQYTGSFVVAVNYL
ncbi:MAG TPA: DUF4402 domain-containing protein [Thermoanaerobaculia bacterium]|nr:DUF4402 domain-containing protein [Thermoanaerobaculia bacterium]